MEQTKIGEEIVDETPEEELTSSKMEAIDVDSLPDKKVGEKYEKPNLDGMTAVIARIELRHSSEVRETKTGKRFYPVLLTLHYDLGEGKEQVTEHYGGVTQFIHGVPPDEKVDYPTIWVDGNSAAAKLFRIWLKWKVATIDDVSFKDFFRDLTGKKVKLVKKDIQYEGRETIKNVVSEFID